VQQFGYILDGLAILGRARKMADANSNPNPNSQPINMVKEKAERLTTPSGTNVEVRWLNMKNLDANNFRQYEAFEVTPPLADSRTVDTVGDIRECSNCLNLYHKDNVSQCSICGDYYCRKCAGEISDTREKNNEENIIVFIPACKICADEANAGILKKFWLKLWNIDR
jgi:hypothetical protein